MRRAFAALPVLLAVFSLFGCTAAGTVLAPDYKAPGKYDETITSGGVQRRYILRIPKQFDGKTPLPLVVLFHGWTGNAKTIESYTGMAAKAEKEGFVLVVPDGLGDPQGWNAGFIDLTAGKKPDDAAFVKDLLDQVEKDVAVDKSRVFFAGHSNGAMLSHYAAAKLSDRVAAIAAVAGTTGIPTSQLAIKHIPEPKTPVSVLIVHGKLDPMVGYGGATRALLKGVSAPDAAAWWAKWVGASDVPEARHQGKTLTQTWPGTRAAVKLITLEEGKHEWPSGATDWIWEFFAANPKRQ